MGTDAQLCSSQEVREEGQQKTQQEREKGETQEGVE